MLHTTITRSLAMTAVLSGPVASQTHTTEPDGPVVLTISGQIEHAGEDGTARFDIDRLEGVGSVTFTTTTIWTDGPQVFTGVPLAHLLDFVGAADVPIRATAINNYSVDFPLEAWREDGPIVAYRNNDAPMSIREKGPLWIVYPYDDGPEFQAEAVFARSIWQLDRIIVGPDDGTDRP